MEEGYQALLALGRDQVTTGVRACAAIVALTTITTDQQARLVWAECQGVTPSNSKGGLPAPEARAHTQEGGVKAE